MDVDSWRLSSSFLILSCATRKPREGPAWELLLPLQLSFCMELIMSNGTREGGMYKRRKKVPEYAAEESIALSHVQW